MLKVIALAPVLQSALSVTALGYVLQVVVTDPLADESHRVVAHWIDFELAQ